jgi:hypothetical protein
LVKRLRRHCEKPDLLTSSAYLFVHHAVCAAAPLKYALLLLISLLLAYPDIAVLTIPAIDAIIF